MGGESIIGEMFKQYGIWGLVLFIICLISLTIFLKFITNIILGNHFKFKENYSTSNKELNENPFFINTKYKLRYDIPTLALDPARPTRQQVYRDLIYLNIESFYYGCKRIVEYPNINDINGISWGNMVKRELQTALHSYEEKAEDFGVPPSILQKYIKWHSSFVDLLNNHIDQISNSTLYDNNILRTVVFLLIMNLLVIVMIGDINKLVADRANSTTGLLYRGNILED